MEHYNVDQKIQEFIEVEGSYMSIYVNIRAFAAMSNYILTYHIFRYFSRKQ